MPQLGSGPSGYNDYQRDANWDSTSLYGLHRPPSAGIDDSPIIPVTRYACIGLYASVNTNPVICQFQWSADALGVSPLGQYTFVMSPLIANPLQMMFPNLGPYVSFSRQGIAAASWGGEGELFATNRQHQLAIYPQNPQLIVQNNIALGNGNNFFYPGDYYAGPVSVWAQMGAAVAASASMQWIDQTGVLRYTDLFSVTTSPGSRGTFIAPVGAWVLLITTGGAIANQCYVSVMPTITGSS